MQRAGERNWSERSQPVPQRRASEGSSSPVCRWMRWGERERISAL